MLIFLQNPLLCPSCLLVGPPLSQTLGSASVILPYGSPPSFAFHRGHSPLSDPPGDPLTCTETLASRTAGNGWTLPVLVRSAQRCRMHVHTAALRHCSPLPRTRFPDPSHPDSSPGVLPRGFPCHLILNLAHLVLFLFF